LIIVSAAPGHFGKARQELATLKQLAGLSQNALAWSARYEGSAKTMIKVNMFLSFRLKTAERALYKRNIKEEWQGWLFSGSTTGPQSAQKGKIRSAGRFQRTERVCER